MNFDLAEMPLPLRFRPGTAMNDEDLMRFCAANEVLRVEREANGEILVMTPAGSNTGRMNAAIIVALGVWAEGDGRGYAFDSNTGFTLPDSSMRSPDAAWVSKSRWDALSREDRDRFAPICPEFVIELRSKTDALPELKTKMLQWIHNGVEVGWLIDPEERTVWVYKSGEDFEEFYDPTTVQGISIMAGFELVMERVWGRQ